MGAILSKKNFNISLKDIQEARTRIQDIAQKTRIEKSLNASKAVGTNVYLKFENEQRTGSFKIRGALNRIRCLTDTEKAKGVVASSAGNHAQGVALAATETGVKSIVVMPERSSMVKQIATRSYGAEVILHGEIYDHAYMKAKEIEAERGMVFVPPFEDPHIIAGQGTVGLEVYEDLPDVDSVVIPIGGGGLISGAALALKSLNPKIKIIGVVAENAPAMADLFNKKPANDKASLLTIADGLGVKKPSAILYEQFISKYVDEVVSVDEYEISAAIVYLLERAKTVVEGSGAVTLAAMMNKNLSLGKKTCALLCGGNIDLNLMAQIIDRGLTRTGRLVRLQVVVTDRPGTLLGVSQVIAELGGNILEVEHDRLAADLHPKETRLEFLLEIESEDQIAKIKAEIKARGISHKVS